MNKKIIGAYTGIWAERLFNLSSINSIDYFIDNDYSSHDWHGKKVFPISRVFQEDPAETLIVVTDTAKYSSFLSIIEGTSFKDGINVVDGWHMPENRDADTYWNCNDEDIIASHEKYWKNRAKIMLSLLPKDVCSLMDFGCGNELCRELLSPNIKYYGLDMKRRNAETLVCDVNKEALPDIAYDCAYMAGFLYYVDNVPGFISKITSKYILCSFIGRELFQRYGDSEIMGRLPGVRSMYYTHEFIHIFLEQGWKLINVSGSRGGINCFLFSKLI